VVEQGALRTPERSVLAALLDPATPSSRTIDFACEIPSSHANKSGREVLVRSCFDSSSSGPFLASLLFYLYNFSLI